MPSSPFLPGCINYNVEVYIWQSPVYRSCIEFETFVLPVHGHFKVTTNTAHLRESRSKKVESMHYIVAWIISSIDLPVNAPWLRHKPSDEDKECLLGGEMNPLADDPHELGHGDVIRHQELLLVDGRHVWVGSPLHDHLYTERTCYLRMLPRIRKIKLRSFNKMQTF